MSIRELTLKCACACAAFALGTGAAAQAMAPAGEQKAASTPAPEPAASQPCGSIGIFKLAYGPGVPYQSAEVVEGKCYCGVKPGVSPSQARDAGWYSSCSNGQCVCNFTPGTIASNACCGPFQCQEHGFPTLTFGATVPYKSALLIGGDCYCGAKPGVSPDQAVLDGWYASCAGGNCICNFTSGTRASNVCCKP